MLPIVSRLWLISSLLVVPFLSNSQTGIDYDRQLRVSIDNDFINIRGKGTDQAYSSGVTIGYYQVKERPGFFLDRWLPKAGKDVVNTYGIELSHLIFTPEDIATNDPQIGDFPYAGALLGTYSLHSSNPRTKLNLQSSINLGVMGPFSFAEDIQKWVHNIIGYTEPDGWNNQHPNDILINVNVGVEKQLLGIGKWAELVGGGRLSAGTLLNMAAVHGLFRVGLLRPYFDGLITQTGTSKGSGNRRVQAYLFVSPIYTYTAHNSLLQGGLVMNENKTITSNIKRFVYFTQVGALISFRNFGFSFTQKFASSIVKNTPSHEVGNISAFFNW